MQKTNLMVILPSYSGGGAERVILNYLSNFESNQINYKLFVSNKSGPLKKNNIYNLLEFKFSRFIFSIPKLLSEIKKNNINILLSTFPNISLIVLLLKKIGLHNCKIIIRQPNMVDASLSRTIKLKLLRFFYKKFIKYSDALIVTSEEMKKESINFKIKKEKIHLLRNPVDIKEIRKNVIPKRKNTKKISLIFVGRLVFQKGIDRIIPAIKENKNIELQIVGDGEQKKNLEKLVKELKLEKRIKFYGYKERPFGLVAGADYFLLPSRWEGLPNSVMESLSLGTPVITFSEVVALKDFKRNILEKSIILIKDENELFDKFNELKVRKDYLKPKLRKSLINYKINSDEYQKKINRLIKNVCSK